MKIVHIAVQHGPRDNRVYHKECISLAQANEVHLLSGPTDGSDTDAVICHRAETSFGYEGSLVAWLRRYILSLFVNFRKALRLRGDVYHVHETPLISLGILLKSVGRRVIYDIHEDAPRQAISIGRNIGRPWLGYAYSGVCLVLENIAKPLFDGFVAATPAIGRRFPASRTTVVQNFAHPAEMEALGKGLKAKPYENRSKQVVYLGGLNRMRGAREIIEAAEEISGKSNVQFKLAGPFDSSAFENECRNLAGWKYVDYLGVLDRKGVLEVLSESRVGLVTMHPLPNYMESWPVKLFEYMAAGVPVIASDFANWREWFGRFDCVRFVDPLDPKAVAQEIEYLLEHEEEAAAMGLRGTRAVRDHFNWQTEARKLFELYAEVEGSAQKLADVG